MSVNAVSGTTLQRDLAGALRLARTGGTQAIDASAFAAASQDTGATQASSSSASQASTVATAPAMSNDLMASLLQLQSDFSQLGLQNGVTTPADAAGTASKSKSKSAEGLDASRAGDGQVHHHRRHASLNGSDAADTAQASQSGGTTDTAATPGTAATASDLGNGLQSFLQQVTKAIAAYATGGPVGVAAAALTTSSKA